MNTADLITSFFNNEMNPEQERQFLISVAASDSMRLGLKSHVMLDRILIDSSQEVHVPDAVRNAIFAEAGAVLAGVSSDTSVSKGLSAARGMKGRWLSNLSIGALGAVLTIAGFGVGYITKAELEPSREPEIHTVLVPNAPLDQPSLVSAPRPATSSTTSGESPRPEAAVRVAAAAPRESLRETPPTHQRRQSLPRSSEIPWVKLPPLNQKKVTDGNSTHSLIVNNPILTVHPTALDSVNRQIDRNGGEVIQGGVSVQLNITKPNADRAKTSDSGTP